MKYMDEIVLSRYDILRVVQTERELPDYWKLTKHCGLKWKGPKIYVKNTIHLSHQLEVPVKAAYRVTTPEIVMIGYLREDGLTIIEY